jgi:hypothetical protein
MGRFHQHFCANYLRAKFDAFFGKRRLANGKQIWRILSLKFGFTFFGVLNGKFFMLLAKKFDIINSW